MAVLTNKNNMKRLSIVDMLDIGRKPFSKIHKQKHHANHHHDVHFMTRAIDEWLIRGVESMREGSYRPRYLKRHYLIMIFLGFFSQSTFSATPILGKSIQQKKAPLPIGNKSNTQDSAHKQEPEGGAAIISSNPAEVVSRPGNGFLQRLVEKNLGIKNNHGFNYGGVWLGDADEALATGVSNPKRLTWNSLFILNLTFDPTATTDWKGGLFYAEFLQLNAQNTNDQLGSIQGYNGLPGPPPLGRSELYQLWYRQSLFDNKLMIKVGKLVPTIDFNNVIKPVPVEKKTVATPSVTGLIYTPICNRSDPCLKLSNLLVHEVIFYHNSHRAA